MKQVLILLVALASLPAMADNCRFNGKVPSGQNLAIQCGMSRAALLDSIGAPLFYDGGDAQDSSDIENWVFRLQDRSGTPKMVSVKLVSGSVGNIMVSR